MATFWHTVSTIERSPLQHAHFSHFIRCSHEIDSAKHWSQLVHVINVHNVASVATYARWWMGQSTNIMIINRSWVSREKAMLIMRLQLRPRQRLGKYTPSLTSRRASGLMLVCQLTPWRMKTLSDASVSINLCYIDILHVEISTELCPRLNSGCILYSVYLNNQWW